MIITIDGPAGVGKTTIGIKLTQTLNSTSKKTFYFLDTGLLYRLVAINYEKLDRFNIADLIQFEDFRKEINYEEKYSFLYTEEVAVKTSKISQIKEVREKINDEIRKKVKTTKAKHDCGFIFTGRDCGTVIFPEADYKFYLYASPYERAKRRIKQYEKLGKPQDLNQILHSIIQRDEEDSKRQIAPLPTIHNLPKDFIIIISDNLTIEQTVQKFLEYIKI
ncbi:MAG: (d)CMP kinase [Candidatus Calescibacterium sp.]|nr:(d)CMP kinase [Candidatus Calescibacterium sp.]MCX7971779.1 (d)CMP kinase [bacterium]MDW8195385.1 (d)CMP kinase [Candidatus Calescibacterium sp.]